MAKTEFEKKQRTYSKLINDKKYDKAIAILNEMKNTNNSSYIYLELGKTYSKLKNYQIARKYLNIVKDIPGYNGNCAKLELGKIERSVGNYKLAISIFNSLLNSDINNVARLQLGKTYILLGNLDEAESEFKKLLVERNRNDARLELAKLYMSVKDYYNARKFYLKLCDNKKNSDEGIFGLGKLEMQLGNYEIAKQHFENVLFSKYHLSVVNSLITLGIKSGDLELTKKYFKKSILDKNYMENDLMLYASSLFNVGNISNNKPLKYSDWQLIDYDIYLAYEHILERNSDSFVENIDIARLLIDIQSYLTDEYKEENIKIYDMYLVPYENCGINGENYIKVVTAPNTKNIITLYPYKQKVLKNNKII